MDTFGGGERGADDPTTRLRENATGIASMLVTATWLAALFTGQVAVVPLVAILFGDEEDRREWADDYLPSSETETTAPDSESTSTPSAGETRDALETLRERYAAGELTDEQFERKLERLLDTETLEDARERVRERDSERGRDREPEYEH